MLSIARRSTNRLARILRRAGFFMLLCCAALPAAAGNWQLDFRQWPNAELEIDPDPVSLERQQYHFGYSGPSHSLVYEHQPLLVRTGVPAHNGYFHLLQWQYRQAMGNAELHFAAGLQGSSNIFKHTDPHREALVASFALSHRLPVATSTSAGLNGDYRFGGFRVYPRLTTRLALTGTSELLIDLPVALLWRSNAGHWQIGFERYGEKWGALDAGREVKSKVYVHEWRFGGEASLPLPLGITRVRAGAGISFDSLLEYLDLEQGWLRVPLGPAVYARLGLHW